LARISSGLCAMVAVPSGDMANLRREHRRKLCSRPTPRNAHASAGGTAWSVAICHSGSSEPEGLMPAKRAYGMDQNFYPWSPIVTRPALRWPDDARVALAVIVNLEHWDWEVPAGTPVAVSPMGGPEGLWSGNQPQFPD